MSRPCHPGGAGASHMGRKPNMSITHPYALGLYNEREKAEWIELQPREISLLQHILAYRKALLNEVEQGTCGSMHGCPLAASRIDRIAINRNIPLSKRIQVNLSNRPSIYVPHA